MSQVNPVSPALLQQSIRIGNDSKEGVIVPAIESRVKTFLAAIPAFEDAAKYLAHSVSHVIQKRTFSKADWNDIVKAGKYLLLALSAIAFGLLLPRAVGGVQKVLGLIQTASKIYRVIRVTSKVVTFVAMVLAADLLAKWTTDGLIKQVNTLLPEGFKSVTDHAFAAWTGFKDLAEKGAVLLHLKSSV